MLTPRPARVAPAPSADLCALLSGRHLRTVSCLLSALEDPAGVVVHDGGVDDRSGLLAGLVSRADIVMFPVDCVSHEAVAIVKRLCRQTAKPYVPLRSSGTGSFVSALARTAITPA